MSFKVPTKPWTMIYRTYKETVPGVHRELANWKKRAAEIPDTELREQAVWTIADKTFHCEGGSVLAMLANGNKEPFTRFLAAYQTICDYLDSLCDKSTSQNPDDFRALHEALLDSLTPGEPLKDYYRYRGGRDDGGYLHSLVRTCQETVQIFPGFPAMKTAMKELAGYYSDFQVYKHVPAEERETLLIAWFERNRPYLPDMRWYEFACCAASTLSIYCLAAYAAAAPRTEQEATLIKHGYFPWMQGVHILLDYFIDQDEDEAEGEMNFCTYYESSAELVERVRFISHEAEKSIADLPDPSFHRMIKRGLFAIYLADQKVQENEEMKRTAQQLIDLGGFPAKFFYANRWVFRREQAGIGAD